MADTVTRRSLAQILAVAAIVPRAASAQTAADADVQSARELLQKNKELIESVKLPMATEPACHFRA